MEIEQEASLMGWVPQDQFKGDESKWVDAASFVERGQHIMPILKKNNERLLGEVSQLKGTVTALTASVAAATESMEAMKVFHEEATKVQVEKARKDLLAGLRQAKTDGDVDAEVEITATLSEFDAAQRAVAAVPVVKKVEQVVVSKIAPEVQEWMNANPWYGQDQERTGFMTGIANRLRAEGNIDTGKVFLEAAAAILEERLGGGQQSSGKVEGGGRSSSSGSGGTGSGYAALPKEAKEVCDKQAAKFVGPDRAFKDMKSWQAYFATQYN